MNNSSIHTQDYHLQEDKKIDKDAFRYDIEEAVNGNKILENGL